MVICLLRLHILLTVSYLCYFAWCGSCMFPSLWAVTMVALYMICDGNASVLRYGTSYVAPPDMSAARHADVLFVKKEAGYGQRPSSVLH